VGVPDRRIDLLMWSGIRDAKHRAKTGFIMASARSEVNAKSTKKNAGNTTA
jgi:hypothetical protein